MKKKSLKSKAIKIKGKDYVMVSDRVIYFNDTYENGCIKTKLISKPEDKTIVIKAYVYPDVVKANRYFTGYAQEVIGQGMINKTSAMENAETSAVGRALAMMGIGVVDSIASVDEINKAKNRKSGPTLRSGEKNGRKWYGIFFDDNKKPIFFDSESKAKAKLETLKMDKKAKGEDIDPDDVPF